MSDRDSPGVADGASTRGDGGEREVKIALEVDAEILFARRRWLYRGQRRPPFAATPGPGQESVWDYPRPPRIEIDPRRVEVSFGSDRLAESTRAVRVLETASPPTYYLPPEDVAVDRFVASGATSMCEWKGRAVDLDLDSGPGSAAWTYPATFPEFESIAGWYSFYPARLTCRVAGRIVLPQPGGYYGGWITDEIVGPVKGEPECEGL